MNQEKELCEMLIKTHLQTGKENTAKWLQEKNLLDSYNETSRKITKLKNIAVNKERYVDEKMAIIDGYDTYINETKKLNFVN